MTTFDVIGFGALNVDKLFKVSKIAEPDEESFVIASQETCGGSAANTAIALARLNCKVGFIGKVAQDREGILLLDDFRREGVNTDGVVIAEQGHSGTVMGFVDRNGQRALYVKPGVNDTIGFREMNKEYASRANFLHLTSFVGGKSLQTQKRLVENLPQKVKLSLDPGELYARKGAALDPLVKRTFVMMPSLKELELLTGEVDYKKGTKSLLQKDVEIVVVKLGSKGCYVTDGKEKYHVETFKSNVVDTTGAGDAFCAGFLYGLISDKNLYECGRIGNFVASRSIAKIGAREGLPHIEDLKRVLK